MSERKADGRSKHRTNLKAQEAFEFYYALGKERNFKRVAEAYNVSLTTVSIWSSKYDWVNRARQRDERNLRLIAEKDDEEYIKSLRSYQDMIKRSLKIYDTGLNMNHIKVETVKDFERLTRLGLDIDDRIIESDNSRIASHLKEAGDSNISSILNCIRGEMEVASRDGSDKSSSGFSSSKDLTDNEEEDEEGD